MISTVVKYNPQGLCWVFILKLYFYINFDIIFDTMEGGMLQKQYNSVTVKGFSKRIGKVSTAAKRR